MRNTTCYTFLDVILKNMYIRYAVPAVLYQLHHGAQALSDTRSNPILATPNPFYVAYRFFCFWGQYGGHFSKQKAKKLAATPHLPYP